MVRLVSGGGGWVLWVGVMGGGGGGWFWVVFVVTPISTMKAKRPYLASRVVPHLRGERG